MREMISLTLNSGKFNVRVAAVALSPDGSHVLIHRSIHEPFWTLPGGRVEMLEPAAVSITREMKEELDLDITVERLLWVVENFFTYDGYPWHELAFYFLVFFPPDATIYTNSQSFTGLEEGMELIFQWQSLANIEDVNLLPAFLRSSLNALPQSTQFITERTELE